MMQRAYAIEQNAVSRTKNKKNRYIKFVQIVVGHYWDIITNYRMSFSLHRFLFLRDRLEISRNKKYRALRLKGHSAVISETSCAEFRHVYI